MSNNFNKQKNTFNLPRFKRYCIFVDIISNLVKNENLNQNIKIISYNLYVKILKKKYILYLELLLEILYKKHFFSIFKNILFLHVTRNVEILTKNPNLIERFNSRNWKMYKICCKILPKKIKWKYWSKRGQFYQNVWSIFHFFLIIKSKLFCIFFSRARFFWAEKRARKYFWKMPL